MKKLLIALFLVTLFSCTTSYEKFDEWEKLKIAVKSNDVNYLLNVSEDTLMCVECNNGKDYIPKTAFFQINRRNILALEDQKYDIIKDKEGQDSIYRINFTEKHIFENGNIIYVFTKKNNNFKFLGMQAVP